MGWFEVVSNLWTPHVINFFHDNAFMIHHTATNWLYYVIGFCINAVISNEKEKYVQSYLKLFFPYFSKSFLVNGENFLCSLPDIVAMNSGTHILCICVID